MVWYDRSSNHYLLFRFRHQIPVLINLFSRIHLFTERNRIDLLSTLLFVHMICGWWVNLANRLITMQNINIQNLWWEMYEWTWWSDLYSTSPIAPSMACTISPTLRGTSVRGRYHLAPCGRVCSRPFINSFTLTTARFSLPLRTLKHLTVLLSCH